jgi:hypothetical protein
MTTPNKVQKWLQHLAVTTALTVLLTMFCNFVYLSMFKLWPEFDQLLTWFIFDYLYDIVFFHSAPALERSLSNAILVALLLVPATSLVLSCFVVWYFRILKNVNTISKHLDGPILLDGNAAFKSINKLTKKEGAVGLKIHPRASIPIHRELGNIFVWGMQGAGKSNFIKFLLKQIIHRADKVIIYDMKGEYTQLFLNEKSTLISPRDLRSAAWDISQDITDTGLAEVFAESVLSAEATTESFWIDSARTVLKGVLIGLINSPEEWGWSSLNDALFSSDKELNSFLIKHYKPAAVLIQPDDKMTASIRSMISAQLSWINEVAKYWENADNTFSISKWLSNAEKTTLLVQGDLKSPTLSSALITALMSLATCAVLARPDTKDDRVWLVLDELGNLNKSRSLEQWLSLGRSKGCRTLAGTQQLSQMNSIYGENNANTILGLFNNVIVFKLAPSGNSPDTASKLFGEHRVEFVTKSTDHKGNKSFTVHQENRPLVEPSKFVHLQQPSLKNGIEGYMLIAGSNAAYKLKWPIETSLTEIADASVTQKISISPAIEAKQDNKVNRLARKKTS